MEVKHVFVSSENRDKDLYPYGNNYVLHLTTPIKEIVKAELVHGSVPNTQYNITDGSNIITLSNVSGTDLTFSIPPGFYGGTSLATELTNAVSNLTDITVSYLQNEGKFLFTRTTNVFTLETTIPDILGAPPGDSSNVAYTSDTTVPLYSDNTRYRDMEFIKSSRVVNLPPNEGVFLDILELRNNTNEDAKASTAQNFYSGQNMSRSFGLIPMDVISGNIKRFKKMNDFDMTVEYKYPIQRLDRLTVRFVDRNGQLINFNGAEDNSFVLRLHTLRK